MRESAILRTLAELDRWTQRRDELRARATRGPEIEMAERQVSYYQALAEDMKRETQPARTGDLFAALTRRR